jgi:hypothetical protein
MMPLDVDKELARLQAMTVRELQAEFQRVWGQTTKSHSKPHLVRRILWRMKAAEEGWSGYPPEVLARARELADLSYLRSRPPRSFLNAQEGPFLARTAQINLRRAPRRLPPIGTTLVREYRGETLRCTVLGEREFEFGGEIYRSLSAVARAATNTNWNGHLFWGLIKRGEK